MCTYSSGVQRLFPEDRLLADMNVEGYVGTPLFDSSGRALGLMVVLYSRPIANPKLAESMLQIFAVRAGAELERRQAEDRLRKSEARWRRVFENSAIGIALTDLDGHFLATNVAYQGMLGYTDEELHARSWLDVTHEDDRKGNWALFMDVVGKKRQQFQIEKRYHRKDGQILWVSNNVSLVPGADGTPGFIMALVEDITERKRLQGQLDLERDHLRLLLEVNNAVVSNIELRPLFAAITASLRKVIQHEYTSLALYDADSHQLRLHVLDFPGGSGVIQEGMQAPIDDSPGGLAFTTRKPVLVNARDLEGFHSAFVKRLIAEGARSACCLPLITPADVAWALCTGADFVNSARGFMFSLGCIQALKCNKNTCPTGVTTHDKRLQKGLDPEDKAVRVAHYCKNMVHEVEVIAHSCGVHEPRQLRRYHVRIVQDTGKSVPMDLLYPYPIPMGRHGAAKAALLSDLVPGQA